MIKILHVLIIAVFLHISSGGVYAQKWPEELSFVGLKKGNWQLFIVDKKTGGLKKIATISESRTPTFHLSSRKVAYIAADGSLVEYNFGSAEGHILLKPNNKRAYTQPAYSPAGEKLYVVELKEGTSVDTDIIVLDKTRKHPKPAVIQRSAQFDPISPTEDTLFYSNVLCTIGCGKIIQEIWMMNIVSGDARQLTLMNSIARQPFLSHAGDWLYFSSNKQGNYHIWRMHMENKQYEQLTEGYVTDINPVLDKNNNLYFIRRSPRAVQLMHSNPQGEMMPMLLPDGVTDIRDLRMSY